MFLQPAHSYALISVFIVSLISLVGVITLSVKARSLRKFLIYLISFSAGALLGDTFLHLLPETIEVSGFTVSISLYILLGIVLFFILEKIINWQHCHGPVTDKEHIHPFAYTNLIGDGLHNFLDGAIIATAYLVNLPVGIATTIAVILHEIPQEIGDFAVLLHAGLTKTKAILLNFASALLAILGALAVFALQSTFENIVLVLIPVAAGGFIYIASSDLIPELHKHSEDLRKSFLQLLAFLLGILIMYLLLALG